MIIKYKNKIMDEKKTKYIPTGYYEATMFAKKLIEEDELPIEKAVSISTNYYKKQFTDITEEEVRTYTEQRINTDEPKENVSEKRTYQYWIVQKSYKYNKGTMYGKPEIIKATSRKNATKQCINKDWECIGEFAQNQGYFIEHKVMSGPYSTRELAEKTILIIQ